jgi:hypothetical protein
MPRKRSRRAGVMGATRLFLRPAKGVSQTPWRLPALHSPFEGTENGNGAPGAASPDRAAELWLTTENEKCARLLQRISGS